MPKEKETEVQQVLDDLFREQLLPFEMSARRLDLIGDDEYIVRFHDQRLRSVDVSCPKGQRFKDAFRTALLQRVDRLTSLTR